MTRRLESTERAAERLGAEKLSPAERRSLWERVQQTRTRRKPSRVGPMAVGVAVASAVATAALVSILGAPDAERGHREIAAKCGLDPNDRTLQIAADCEPQSVRVGEGEWRLEAGTKVARVEGGAQILSGRVEFRVEPRSHSPFRVRVSGGHQVRVVGTVFVVEQRAGAGSVSVSEGAVEFLWSDGARDRVVAGQTLRWPRQPAIGTSVKRDPAPPPADSTSASESVAPEPSRSAKDQKARAAPGAPALEDVMDRVLQLKSQRRYSELMALLRKTLGDPSVGRVQRERISYELGLAMESAGRRPCAHWKRHVEQFGTHRYAAGLEERLKRCERAPETRPP